MKYYIWIFSALIYLSVNTNLHAEIFIWTDEDGVKHYTNKRPPNLPDRVRKRSEVKHDPVKAEEFKKIEEKLEAELRIDELEAENEELKKALENVENRLKINEKALREITRQYEETLTRAEKAEYDAKEAREEAASTQRILDYKFGKPHQNRTGKKERHKKIEQLKDMLNKGAITREEYDKRRAELL